jgi:hypothetical protein
LLDGQNLPDDFALAHHFTWPLRIIFMASYPSNRADLTVHRSEPQAGCDPLSHKTMILFQEVVEIRQPPAAAALAQFVAGLQSVMAGACTSTLITVGRIWLVRTMLAAGSAWHQWNSAWVTG